MPARQERKRARYAFGDSDIAAQRLEVIAEVFFASSVSFLLHRVMAEPRRAVDLGCGPGFSTHLVARALRDGKTVGLDNSERFIGLAKRTETEAVSFRLHDVTVTPFPVEPADLLYCRFLLAHLQKPDEVVAGWASQVNPGAFLVMEEVERIRTAHNVFATYLDIVETMLNAQANTIYAGRVVSTIGNVVGFEKIVDEVASLPVTNQRAATMFLLNIQSWKDNEFIRKTYPNDVIVGLQSELASISRGSGGESEIEWGLRQAIFRRA